MNPSDESSEVEVVETSALGELQRAEIDMQIATAKKFPRSPGIVKQKMLSLATLDAETAAGCFYTLPPRKGSNQSLVGPSVRLAEIAVASYGNIRAGMRVVGNDGKFITAQGFCHDLENNTSIAMEVKRRITDKNGNTYGTDMQQVTGMAACSIAFRNAVFKVVPLAIVKPVCREAMKCAVGDIKSIAARRVEAVKVFIDKGVAKDKIFAALGVKTIEDIGVEQLTTLIGFWNSVQDGDTTLEEIFAPKIDTEAKPATGAGLAEVDAPKAEKPKTEAPAEKPAPAAKPTEDELKAKKALVNLIEGLALDLGLTLTKLLEMATPQGGQAPDKLVSASLATLDAIHKELSATKSNT